MLIRTQGRSYVWFPVLWFLFTVIVGGLFAAFVPRPDSLKVWASVSALVGLPLFLFLSELCSVTHLPDGTIRIRRPLGTVRGRGPASFMNVGWNTKSKYPVWVTDGRKVKVGGTTTTNGASIDRAERIAGILEIAHKIDPAVRQAAGVERRAWSSVPIVIAIVVIVASASAFAAQYWMTHR